MKKILFIVLFIALAFTGYSKNVLSFNGNDWGTWGYEAKYMWTMGYATAHSALIFAIIENEDLVENDEEVIDYLVIDTMIENIIGNIDAYYDYTGDYQASVWAVIYHVYGKSWWGIEEEEQPIDAVLLNSGDQKRIDYNN